MKIFRISNVRRFFEKVASCTGGVYATDLGAGDEVGREVQLAREVDRHDECDGSAGDDGGTLGRGDVELASQLRGRAVICRAIRSVRFGRRIIKM